MARKDPHREGYEKLKEKYPGLTWEDYIASVKNESTYNDMINRLEQEKFDENVDRITEPDKIIEDRQTLDEKINPLIEADKEREQKDRETYKDEALKDVTTELPGLTPNQRRQLQQSANSQINKQVQKYQRSMASKTGKRGIRGGAAFAPQAEIARQGMDAQNQFQRDLVEKDTDLAMRRLAAYLAQVEGRTAQDILRRGQYYDFITGKQQQGKQSAYERLYDDLLSKVK